MKKVVIKGILFAGIFLIISAGISEILRKKWNFREDNAASRIVTGFYEEPAHTLDVAYFGMSTMRNGISPLTIWKNYGITGYSRAGSVQSAVVSYYLLQETFDYQSPSVIVMEAGTLMDLVAVEGNDYDYSEGKIHENIDYMRNSKWKWKLAREIAEDSDLSIISLLVPLYRYHDRWTDIEAQDFEYLQWDKRYPYKGQYPVNVISDYKFPDSYMNSKDEEVTLDEKSKQYVRRMKELCDEKGCEFLLVKMPTSAWNQTYQRLTEEFAKEIGCGFVDYNEKELREAVDLEAAGDYIDAGSHLNTMGAKKISQHLGQYLQETYGLADKRGEIALGQWDFDSMLYEREEKSYVLAATGSIIDYLELLQDKSYHIMFSTRYDTSTYFTPQVYERMKALGLKEDLSEEMYSSYGAMIAQGQVLFEKKKRNNETVSYYNKELRISISSTCSFSQTNFSSIVIDGVEYSNNRLGLNIVVYDTKLNRVVNSKTFDIGKTGGPNLG